MKIAELNDNQKHKLIEALEADDFANVQDCGAYITYSKGYRDFELYSLSFGAEYNYDDFVNIYFREKEFFHSKLNTDASLKYSDAKSVDFQDLLKTRHSTSMQQKSLASDDDSAIESILGWKLVTTYDLKDTSKFYTIPESTELKHIMIKGKSHIALNHGEGNHFSIYEGTTDLVFPVLQEDPENFVMTPNFVKVAGDLKLEANDL